ncbi:MAG: molybdopterin molybdotransferase MoeA [Rhizobiaceae bacterium]|nr:molybdopterin molybdotransferase MoeA [Rhizobiaceae bacterium]
MSLISVDDAVRLVMVDAAPVSATEAVALRNARDRILAADLYAERTQPGFDASAMDGYAVRATDAAPPFAPLRLVGEAAAGHAFGGRLAEGEAVRIFTGAPVPEGADAILIQENAERSGPYRVRPSEAVAAGRHIRRAGADFSAGERLLSAGMRLSSGALALAASGGHPMLSVLRRPRVAILATGDELVLPGEPVGPSQIVASNTFGVGALVESAGGEVLDCAIAPDDEAAIADHLDRAVARGVDVFVTIGGASVGDHDLVGKVFADKGVALDFWKVAMRPGKPLMAGRIGATRVIGLPGNPASSMVAATLFLRPLVEALAGRPRRPDYRSGILGRDMSANEDRADFVRASLDDSQGGIPVVTPFDRQDSSLLSIYAQANALLLRPPHAGPAKAGDACLFVGLD